MQRIVVLGLALVLAASQSSPAVGARSVELVDGRTTEVVLAFP
jgi:hypothetical protein